jgi:putative transposase
MEKLGHSTPAALRTYLGVDRRDVRRASIKVELGVSEQTFYTWRRKFAGMGVAELRELRQLRHENRKLKQLVADLSLDKHMLQEVLSKKV